MSGGTIAPGVTNTSIVNPDALPDAHYAILTDQSYTHLLNSTTMQNGTVQSRRINRTWMAANRTAFLYVERRTTAYGGYGDIVEQQRRLTGIWLLLSVSGNR